VPNIRKLFEKNDRKSTETGNEKHGKNWDEIFKGLKKDK
jgi:hypothetical protein